MRSDANTVDDYLAALTADRRDALTAVRQVILQNLPAGYAETMNWGMICYEVPLAIEPKTYNGKPLVYAALAAQKRYMALYLCGLTCMPGLAQDFKAQWTGGRLDMGKACIRFRALTDLDLALIAKTIAAVPVAAFAAASRR